MTLKLNNFVFLATQVSAMSETIVHTEYMWFYLYFINGEKHQFIFYYNKFIKKELINETTINELLQKIEESKATIRNYMSNSELDIEIQQI